MTPVVVPGTDSGRSWPGTGTKHCRIDLSLVILVITRWQLQLP